MRYRADRERVRCDQGRARESDRSARKKISRDNIEDYRNHEDSIMQLLHTMIRVNDLDESLKFYCDKLGMKLLRKNDFPGGKFTLAFVGYGDEKNHTVVELTHNWDTHKYDIGTAFGHLAIGVPDAFKACEELKQDRRAHV